MRATSSCFAGLIAAGLSISPALAIDLTESVDIGKPASEVWGAIENWCSIAAWHPVIAACEGYEDNGKTMRKLSTGDGGVLIEELTARNEDEMSFSYVIIESPLPIADYASTMQVRENGEGATITWSSTYDAKGVSDDEAFELMTGIYRAGLDQLKVQLGQ